MSFVFLVWHPPWSISFSGMVWRLPITVGDVSAQKLCQASGDFSLEQAGMLTGNANSSSPTLSHALQQVNAAGIGVICQGASSAPLQGSKGTAFNLFSN